MSSLRRLPWWIVLAAVLSVVATVTPASACSCLAPTFDEEREKVDVLVEARVVSVVERPPEGMKGVRVVLGRRWKGDVTDAVVWTHASGTYCGIDLQPGRTYFVSGMRQPDGSVYTDYCFHTMLADQARSLVARLGAPIPSSDAMPAPTPAPGAAPAGAPDGDGASSDAPASPSAGSRPLPRRGCGACATAPAPSGDEGSFALFAAVVCARRRRRIVHRLAVGAALAGCGGSSSSVATPEAGAGASPASLQLPHSLVGGHLTCGTSACRVGFETCCDHDSCRPPAPGPTAPLAESIAGACGAPTDRDGQRAFPLRRGAAACSDSSQCAPDAICCPARVPSSVRDAIDGPEYVPVQLCTDVPARDCADLEVCTGATCRALRPDASIPCGAVSCSGKTPYCRHDGRAAADRAGGPALRPVCVAPDTPPRTVDEYEVQCLSPADCAPGAQCVFHAYSKLDSFCAYNPPASSKAYAAPACRSDADCKSVLPRWERFMTGAERASSADVHCRPVRGDPAHRSVCAMPWGLRRNGDPVPL